MEQENVIRKMEEYADEHGVPIMEKEGIEFLIEFIKHNKIKSILEVGTAIGYSAIKMALISYDITITTIERDEVRYLEAVKNVKALGLQDRINLVLGDALEYIPDGMYDLIFIDAAKSQYIKFFEKYTKNLNEKGYVISDNINFHGLTNSDKSKLSRNLRQLIGKLERYIAFLKENTEFKTRFFEIGDGIAISNRKDKDENIN